jgi:predicted CXXCH cytochrome family protein
MTQVARPETVLAPFDNIQLESGGWTYILERRGDEFWVDMVDPYWERELMVEGVNASRVANPPRVQRRIVMTTGSHHRQAYWIRHSNGTYYQFPWNYDIEEQRWIPLEAAFLTPPGEGHLFLVWNANCIHCHAVHGQPRLAPSELAIDSRVAELGIACEACHGPGEEHVRVNQDPRRRYRQHMSIEPDPTIVNPARCSPRISSQICGQCHSFSVPKGSVTWWDSSRYRPGDDLQETREIVGLAQQRAQHPDPNRIISEFWEDGNVRVAGREYNGLIESACFQRGELSCLSCHSMHQSDPNDQLAAAMAGNEACYQCHSSYRDRLQEHTHHQPASNGSLCYNCHMPHTTYGLFAAMRSHGIDSPSAAVSARTGRPNACNLCHLDQTLAWTSQHLSRWYGFPAVELEQDEQQIAASLLWLLRGDAGQRVITAWSMGWGPAHEASGREWLAPYLGQLLDDPYAAVRFVAYRSLRRLPGYAGFAYDFVGPAAKRSGTPQRVIDAWAGARSTAHRNGARVLLDPPKRLRWDVIERLKKQRDDRPIQINE